MRKLLLTIGALLALLLAGCGGSDSSTDGGETASEPFRIPAPNPKVVEADKYLKIKPNGLFGSEPKPIIPDSPPPDDLALTDLVEGIGTRAAVGTELTVQYVGVLYDTGEKFESSWDEGKPFTFTLGAGEVIEGWEEGLLDMEVSDRRELVIPPDLAYGSEGKGDIPPDATLVYVVDLLDVKGKPDPEPAPPEEEIKTDKTKPKVTVPQGPPPKDLVVNDIEEGTGPVAKKGDEVIVHYVGVDYKTGKEFEASWDRDEPFTFIVGGRLVIKGWDQGVAGMKVGGRRELVIPPEYGYGSQKAGKIKPNSTLVFVIDLLAVNKVAG